MYIPPHFDETDPEILLDLINAEQFGILLSGEDVTHLPFIVLDRDPAPRLFAHFAGKNPHGSWIGQERPSRLIVNGPHAYVSPTVYANQTTVPTWDFITVHLHGRLVAVPEEQRVPLMQRQVEAYEGVDGWRPDGLPEGYFDELAQHVTPFVFEVKRMVGKAKLNQNKPREDVVAVIEHLERGTGTDRALAHWMRRVTLDPGNHR